MILSNTWRGALLALTALSACTDPGVPEQCGDFESPTVTGYPDASLYRARVTVETAVTVDATGKATTASSIAASFTDVSKVMQDSRTPSAIASPGCYGLTGSPTKVCRPGVPEPCVVEYLDVESVVIEGLDGGPYTLTRDSKGIYSKELGDKAILGGGTISLKVTGKTQAGWFPTFENSIPSLEALAISAPVAGSTTPLGAGDLKVRWNRSTAAHPADYVVLNATVTGGTTTTTDKIQCILADDGCQTITGTDLDLFDMKVGKTVKLSASRENARMKTLDGGYSLDLRVSSRVEMTVTR